MSFERFGDTYRFALCLCGGDGSLSDPEKAFTTEDTENTEGAWGV